MEGDRNPRITVEAESGSNVHITITVDDSCKEVIFHGQTTIKLNIPPYKTRQLQQLLEEAIAQTVQPSSFRRVLT